MSVSFLRGQQLGRNDLNIFLTNTSGTSINAAEISYALYDFTTGLEVLVGPLQRSPANPSVGEYYASIIIPLDANVGTYRIRWTFKELLGGPTQTVLQEFALQDRETVQEVPFSMLELDLIRRLRTLTRDNNPDRNYRFRPPSNEETISQYNRVFGFVWEDEELLEYLQSSMDMIIAAPPRTPFSSLDQMMQSRAEWKTLLLTGAMIYALQALQINWVQEEFGYSIGGVSLDLEKSSKFESAKQGASDLFDKQLEKAKLTVKFTKGLQQPKYGMGIRSSFGPFTGAGVLTPAKFSGFG